VAVEATTAVKPAHKRNVALKPAKQPVVQHLPRPAPKHSEIPFSGLWTHLLVACLALAAAGLQSASQNYIGPGLAARIVADRQPVYDNLDALARRLLTRRHSVYARVSPAARCAYVCSDAADSNPPNQQSSTACEMCLQAFSTDTASTAAAMGPSALVLDKSNQVTEQFRYQLPAAQPSAVSEVAALLSHIGAAADVHTAYLWVQAVLVGLLMLRLLTQLLWCATNLRVALIVGRLRHMWKPSGMLSDLVHFACVLALLVTLAGAAAYLVVGGTHPSFSSLGSSIFTVTALLLKSKDAQRMFSTAAPHAATSGSEVVLITTVAWALVAVSCWGLAAMLVLKFVVAVLVQPLRHLARAKAARRRQACRVTLIGDLARQLLWAAKTASPAQPSNVRTLKLLAHVLAGHVNQSTAAAATAKSTHAAQDVGAAVGVVGGSTTTETFVTARSHPSTPAMTNTLTSTATTATNGPKAMPSMMERVLAMLGITVACRHDGRSRSQRRAHGSGGPPEDALLTHDDRTYVDSNDSLADTGSVGRLTHRWPSFRSGSTSTTSSSGARRARSMGGTSYDSGSTTSDSFSRGEAPLWYNRLYEAQIRRLKPMARRVHQGHSERADASSARRRNFEMLVAGVPIADGAPTTTLTETTGTSERRLARPPRASDPGGMAGVKAVGALSGSTSAPRQWRAPSALSRVGGGVKVTSLPIQEALSQLQQSQVRGGGELVDKVLTTAYTLCTSW
jgi:hypothetical protein